MSLYVVRHGRVPSNDNGIISGRGDERLTYVGVKQVESVRDRLKNVKFTAIYSSNVLRAIETAKIINVHNLNLKLDERLAERYPGKAFGRARKEIDKAEWNSLTLDKTKEGAETLKAGLVRTGEVLEEIHTLYPSDDVLIVTHNFICKCIWMLENNITDMDEINSFMQKNDEIKIYRK